MVAAWDDPSCALENCLPIASKNEEEVVDGQRRTIVIGLPNHQGPCPPEGVPPIPEAQYERIRALWPSYGFEPYADRAQNPQCL
jgi:MoxR-like ATPase